MKLTTLALASISLAAFGQAPAPTPAPRLLCMYLDLNALSPADLTTAQDQAIEFLEKQATPADRVAVMTYTSRLNVLSDFTNDRDTLTAVLKAIMLGQVSTPDDFLARLQGIEAAAAVLGAIPDKKAVIYFSSGIPRTSEDQAGIRAATAALARANVSLYPVDARGLVAPPR
jgi:VWFA-related protein